MAELRFALAFLPRCASQRHLRLHTRYPAGWHGGSLCRRRHAAGHSAADLMTLSSSGENPAVTLVFMVLAAGYARFVFSPHALSSDSGPSLASCCWQARHVYNNTGSLAWKAFVSLSEPAPLLIFPIGPRQSRRPSPSCTNWLQDSYPEGQCVVGAVVLSAFTTSLPSMPSSACSRPGCPHDLDRRRDDRIPSSSRS